MCRARKMFSNFIEKQICKTHSEMFDLVYKKKENGL